jgi:hypothetical protein
MPVVNEKLRLFEDKCTDEKQAGGFFTGNEAAKN